MTKHAGHLVRLLRMGREILLTGKVHVWRGVGPGLPGDAAEIQDIRNGAWKYDDLVQWAEAEDAALEKIYKDRAYVVPKQPDRERLSKMCMKMIESFFAREA